MAQETKPSIFKWASAGSVVSMDSVKQALGWTAEKPTYMKMNWLFQQITQHLSHINAYGFGVWDAATDYAFGAIVTGSDNVKYECVKVPCVNQNPTAGGSTYWAAYGTPAGEVKSFAMSTAPAGYLKANGAAVSRTTYARLFAAIGTTFGVGDGSTTFNLPDLRGEFIRGWDDGRGADVGRAFGSFQADGIKNHKHDMKGDAGTQFYATNDDNTVPSDTGAFRAQGPDDDNDGQFLPDSGSVIGATADTRPRNVALLYCIKF